MDAAARTAAGGGGVSAIVEYDYAAKEPDELDLVKGAIIHNIKQMPGGWWEGTLPSNGKTGMFPDNFVRIADVNDESSVTLRDKSATSNRRCKVIYSYTQVNDDELSLAVGDVIEFLGEVEEGWWRGRLKTKIGVFPSNFVVAIEPSPILASKRPPSIMPAATLVASAKLRGGGGVGGITSAISTSTTATSSSLSSSSSTKKTNRLSFHSSKEDLLNSTISISSAAAAGTTTTGAATAAVAPDDAAPSLPPKPQRDYCRVDFPYAPQNDDELELKVGDVITIINMDLPDKGWWKGELRGKVGVFPDNFVKLMAPSDVAPINDPQQSHRTAKNSNAANSLATSAAVVSSTSSTTNNIISSTSASVSSSLAATSTNVISSTNTAATTSKVFIKKSGSTSSTQSSNRKDSFGSRDSLNDILSETGLPSGNVAAQRKSLENKNLDLSNAPDASTRLGLKKPQLQQVQETTKSSSSSLLTTTTTNNSSSSSNNFNAASSSTSNTTTSSSSTNIANMSNSSTTELRKSLENLDEKSKTTPPPVLTKKPTVPTKKSATVTSVAGNLLSGLKQKVKNVENKLTTAVSADHADGVGSSKMSSAPGGGLPDAAPSGNVIMRRAATIAVEDTDFDRVERASILTDMRAGRVKAPKRRPPSAAINVIGESNNNNSVYLNGSNVEYDDGGSGSGGKTQSSDENSTEERSGGGGELAKPKPREWEKKKAPWMDELKASQVKKKTSPNVEPRHTISSGTAAERTSKLLLGADVDAKITSTSSSSTTSGSTSTITSSSASSSSTKVQSSAVSSSMAMMMQQSMTTTHEQNSSSSMSTSSSQQLKKELSADLLFSKSMTGKLSTDGGATLQPLATVVDDVRARPNSLSIRNRSISPSLTSTSGNKRTSSAASASPATSANEAVATSNSEKLSSAAANKTTTIANNHQQQQQQHASDAHAFAVSASPSSTNHENNIAASGKTSATSSNNEGKRVVELERRVEKLEAVVHAQQRSIDELMRTLREETDRVKVLRGELDKYAQCVTQV